MKKLRVIVGASNTSINGWIMANEQELNILDLNSWENFFQNRRIDVILAEHVWENFTIKEGIIAAKNCYEYLKPGGFLRCSVPDKNFDNEWYQDLVKIDGIDEKNLPANSHKVVYDYTTTRIL